MNNKIQLLSSKPNPETEKVALQLLAKGVNAAKAYLPTLAARRDFVGGLAAPVTKFIGGLQRAYGRGQQGFAAVRQGLGSSVDDLAKNPLYQRGAQNAAAGTALRQQSGLLAGLRAPNPLSYRAGRGIGAVAIGAPLFNLPFTAAEYAGASSADPSVAEEYAKNMAYQRVEDRLNQFQNMPFLDRAKAVFNPQGFTQQLQMPEASDLYQSMADDNIGNPSVLKYLSSFNPFLGSAGDVINQKVRSQMFDSMQPKSANEKKANLGLVLKGLGAAWKAGRGSLTSGAVKGVQALPAQAVSRLNAIKGAPVPIWEAALQKGVYNAARSPLGTLGTAATLGLTPYALKSMYDSGNQSVYDSAANNAMGMADLQLMNQFNQPGFMGGLGRAGMAIAPGMGRDMILKRVRQSMFPEVNQQQY
jgi:hypothetical protein